MRRRAFLALCASLPAARVLAETPAAVKLPSSLQEMDFTLVDDRGVAVRPRDLAGRPALIFFGFTYCPEICPTTLGRIGTWLDEMSPAAAVIQPVLITVDPERDTVAALSEYVSAFDPALRGWTGTPDEIARAADAFGVVYRKVPLAGGDYTMDHTAGVFMFRADGGFAGVIDYHEAPELAVAKLRKRLIAAP